MKEEFINIENENSICRISIEEIFSISVSSGILQLCAKNGRVYSKTMTLNKGVELLPSFMKINKSEAINLLYVKEILKKSRQVILDNDSKYEVSYRNMPILRSAVKKLRSTT